MKKTFHPARLLDPARLLNLVKTSTLPAYSILPLYSILQSTVVIAFRIDALGSYFLTSFIKCSAELVLERIRFFLRDEPMLENLK